MRTTLIILATLLASAIASYLSWKDVLYPTVPALPPAPTLRQRQFGMWLTPETSARLERRLPADFTPSGGLEKTVKAISRHAGVYILFNWRVIEFEGGRRDAPVTTQIAGMKAGDALLAILADQKPPLAAAADSIALTITTPFAAEMIMTTQSYVVTDLAPTAAEQQQLITHFQSVIAPHSWKTNPDHPVGSVNNVSGKLTVRINGVAQYDLARFFNDLRYRKAQLKLAARAIIVALVVLVIDTIVLLILHLRDRRRRMREGHCRRCGYDLRASTERCPECGTPFITPVPERKRWFGSSLPQAHP
jgi:hypothetical protein